MRICSKDAKFSKTKSASVLHRSTTRKNFFLHTLSTLLSIIHYLYFTEKMSFKIATSSIITRLLKYFYMRLLKYKTRYLLNIFFAYFFYKRLLQICALWAILDTTVLTKHAMGVDGRGRKNDIKRLNTCGNTTKRWPCNEVKKKENKIKITKIINHEIYYSIW